MRKGLTVAVIAVVLAACVKVGNEPIEDVMSSYGESDEGKLCEGEPDEHVVNVVRIKRYTNGNSYVAHYTGGMRDGLEHGRGDLTMPDGARYGGRFCDGVQQGQGHVILPNGEFYQCTFRDGQLIHECTLARGQRGGDVTSEGSHGGRNRGGHGQHVVLGGAGVVSGGAQFVDKVIDVLQSPDGTRIVDAFRGRPRYGVLDGVNILPDGTKTVGWFRDGLLHGDGNGAYKSPDGTKIAGSFRGGLLHGNGEGAYVSSDGTKFAGNFRGGLLRHGEGTLMLPSGISYFGCKWRDGKLQGEGIVTLPGGRCFVGEYHGGTLQGQAQEGVRLRDGTCSGEGFRKQVGVCGWDPGRRQNYFDDSTAG